MNIRAAVPDDLAALTKIYNHYIETSHATFDLAPYSVEERRAWFDQFAKTGRHRLLVATDPTPIAYAGSMRWRPKAAYDCTVELTIYCAPDACGKGLATRLCQELFAELAAEDVASVVGGVSAPNPASVALLTRLGFERVGTFQKVGRKFGQAWDVDWFQKSLRAGP